ncbi:MAG TPA: hypothetical protein VL961_01510 [Acidimicrobiales bacterium]|nr:hypothetical protein [Acidimicrobiales bacterium]
MRDPETGRGGGDAAEVLTQVQLAADRVTSTGAACASHSSSRARRSTSETSTLVEF